jgi:hypothetical protein
MNLNWTDIAIHAGISAALTFGLLLAGVPELWAMAWSTAVWLTREVWQHRHAPLEVFTRPQPLLEWLAPTAITAIIIAIPLPVGYWLN